MATIDDMIKQSLNPFDTSAVRNFWLDQESSPTVASIHQKQLQQNSEYIRQKSEVKKALCLAFRQKHCTSLTCNLL